MFSRIISFVFALTVSLGALAAPPKYIFYFIGDGMGMGHTMATETYNRTVLGNDDKILMMQFPVSSFAMTYSYQNPITDSAAAGTALSTGHKTSNGMLGMNPDTVAVVSIARELKDNGYGVAIASSVTINDATPAAFYAHQPKRSMFYEIGKDMAASNYDFFAGPGIKGTEDSNGNPTDLLDILTKNGYTIVRGVENMPQAKDKKKIILFDKEGRSVSSIGFTIDSVPDALTLPEITRQSIAHMKKVSPDAFFMMIEGGNIDYAGHANDGGTAIKEILKFNEALREAYNFYLQHPEETLIVVTADHDTGGMTTGVEKGPKKVNFKNIDYQKVSKDAFSNMCKEMIKTGKEVEWSWMKKYLMDNFGLYTYIPVSKEQNEDLIEEFEKTFKYHASKDKQTLYNSFNEFVEEIFEILDHTTGFGWTTPSHTGNPVPVFAVGNGAEEFRNVNNNIDIPDKIRKITGLKK